MKRYRVYHRGRCIDTVFFTDNCDIGYVKHSLVQHDNFPPDIEVRQK